jgi:hypothetical protein
LNDPEEMDEVNDLLMWWNWYVRYVIHFSCSDVLLGSHVFPSYVTRERAVTKESALARLKAKRAERQERNGMI